MKPLSISNDVWQLLRQIKKEQGLKHLNQAVKWLVEQLYYIEEETSAGKQKNKTITNGPTTVSIKAIETTVAPSEEIHKLGKRLSLDRKTRSKRLHKTGDTNLPLGGTSPHVNLPHILRTGGRIRQRPYASQHQSFPGEKTIVGNEEKTNITDDHPMGSNKVIETTVQPFEEVLKVADRLSIDRKTPVKRLHKVRDTNLPLAGTSSCTNQAQFLGKDRRLRRRLDTRKQ